MSKRTMYGLAAVCALALFAPIALAGPQEDSAGRNEQATQVARAWFASLMQGQTAVTTALSETPFSFDRKQKVASLTDLKKLYDDIVKEKGKRDLKPTAVKIGSSSPENVEVILMIEDEGIAVIVKPGEAFRVTGFSD